MKLKNFVDGYFGVWRTIGGRRVFIRDGEDLSSAMDRSGKFKKKQQVKELKARDHSKKVLITKEAISKVNKLDLEKFDNDLVLSKTKELLEYSMNRNHSNEVALVITETGKFSKFIDGDEGSVDYLRDTDTMHWLRSGDEGAVLLIHNHPKTSYFSMDDLREFIHYDNLNSMIAVTNLGKSWFIQKTDLYDHDYLVAVLDVISNKYSLDSVRIEKLLKYFYNNGIRRN